MGTRVRLIRFTAGLGLMILGILNGEIIGDTLLNVAVSAFGGMNVISAVMGTCPACLLINLSTSHSHGSANGETEQESLQGRVDEGVEKSEEVTPLRRKLLLCVVVPMLLLLILFGSSIFKLSQQSALSELNRQPVAAVQLVAAYLQDHSRTADGIPNPEDEQQVAAVLQPLLSRIELFMLHDATGQRLASTFEKAFDSKPCMIRSPACRTG